jgi:hypothetical protein
VIRETIPQRRFLETVVRDCSEVAVKRWWNDMNKSTKGSSIQCENQHQYIVRTIVNRSASSHRQDPTCMIDMIFEGPACFSGSPVPVRNRIVANTSKRYALCIRPSGTFSICST